jgi:hypothetical protein
MEQKKRKAPPTAFKKGQSGNPSGRPKVVGYVQEMAREQTVTAIKTLVAIMKNEEQPAAARVAAANAILDRGYGKPTAEVNLNVKRERTDYTIAELEAIVAAGSGEGTAGEEAGGGPSDIVH